MRYSFGSLVAAAIVFGLPIAAPTAANAESVMRTCVTQWKQAEAAGTTGGQTWPQFLAQCRTTEGAAGAAPATAPASQSGSLLPWWGQPAPAAAPASNAGGSTAHQSVMRLCASRWKDAKAAGTTGGQTWPQFLAQCRASQGSVGAAPSGGGFASAPAQAPAPSQSGSLFPWQRPAAPASNVGAPSAARAGEYATELQARAQCPSETVVWTNTSSGIYHYPGTRYYGHTRQGAYMCEPQARAAGYRASRSREQAAQTH